MLVLFCFLNKFTMYHMILYFPTKKFNQNKRQANYKRKLSETNKSTGSSHFTTDTEFLNCLR